MALATEFAPSVPVPVRARLRVAAPHLAAAVPAVPAAEPAWPAAPEAGDWSAPVRVLHAPSTSPVAAPVRLTRRGVVVLSMLVCAVGAALVWLAAASAAPAPATPSGSAATVTVRPGDTLWSIAGRVAPQADPRAEVDTLQRLNHLSGPELVVGQVLRLR